MASLYAYFRISKPSPERVPPSEEAGRYQSLRRRTFWGVTLAYCLFYVCRMTLGVVKQPLIDGGLFTAGQLGIISSALLIVYAVGKFMNGFLADYCNIRRFMAAGLLVSVAVNLSLGLLGLVQGWPSVLLFGLCTLLWGLNGWAQSMGAPPAVISLSRWFPLKERGTWYSILCASPYLGKAVSLTVTGIIVAAIGWQYGFLFSALAGLGGVALILFFVSDTPESRGLPSVQVLCNEPPREADAIPTRLLQKKVLRHYGVWVIALSSAFVYITQYGLSNWGVLFLQKGKDFSLQDAAWIIGLSEGFGIAGTVLAGWLSDKVFRGNRVMPVILSGGLCLAALALFLFTGGGYVLNVLYVSVFSIAIGVLYCIVAGLMALDIVPRKATGAALGIVGISSYLAAGLQDVVSGFLIQNAGFDFTGVAVFWLVSCAVATLLPVLNWKSMQRKVVEF